MNEEHDGENEEFDREEIEHVENMLYANIHHNSCATESPISSTNALASQNQNSGSNKECDTDRRNSGSRRNAKRYWSSDTPGTSNTPNFVPYFKGKQSGIYKSTKPIVTEHAAPELPQNVQETTTAPIAPKQFTPYVSFLPFNDSGANMDDEQIPVAGTSKGKVLKTTNEMVRKSLPSATQNINPFSKKQTISEYKKMFNIPILPSNENSSKRLNPFNPLSKKAKRKKLDTKQNQNPSPNKSVRKNRAELKEKVMTNEVVAVEQALNVVAKSSVIEVDDDDKIDESDDDDVIILPTQAPPLICVDDSDDEITSPNTQEHAFTEPNAVADSHRKVARCSSPSSSIQSADDFIAQNDQRNFGFETFGTMSDDDLCQVSETVIESSDNNCQPGTSKQQVIAHETDNAVFTPPKQMQKDKTKVSAVKKSYEVTTNFTAVDVYESESSDMPDSIYAKGMSNKRKKLTDSDSSSVESIPISKAKRLRKRKCSGSAKESDKHSDDTSSDLPEMNDTDDDDEADATNGNSYLVRGEALGKVKNTKVKKKNVVRLSESTSEKNDKFINQLSDIFRGQNESDDDNDDIENTQETSTESVAARDIVETVLQRRTKKSKRNQSTQNNDTEPPQAQTQTPNHNNAPVQAEIQTDNPQAWEVTDEIGETDDLNLGRIFDESALNTSNESDESERQRENNSKAPDIQPTPNQPNQPNNDGSIDATNSRNDEPEENVNDNDPQFFKREVSWNEEMRRFYNESWGGETFSVNNIRSRMPRGFLNWMISNRDKSMLVDNRRQTRCLNCQERGHKARNCPQPPAVKRCYMCGVEGHLEPRCPNKICLLCGRKTQKYSRGCNECARDREMTCFVCKQKGHKQRMCPDRWRRYHSTTSLNQPLVQESTNLPPRSKYCCICAQRGHEAETCYRNNRTPGPFSVHVASYRPLLHPPKQAKPNTAPTCTILASDINNFSFNFGNDVSTEGSSIYARFRRAVNLNQNHNTTNENDVMFVDESNLHDTSDPPIEIYDDFDYDMDNISSSEQFLHSEGNSFMSIDNFEGDSFVANDSSEAQVEHDSLNKTIESAEAELQELDNKLQTLNDLKQKIRSRNINANDNGENINDSETANQTNTNIDTDAQKSDQRDDVSTSNPLPDFIPLTTDKPEIYEPIRSPSPVSADSTTNEKTDATIHLTAKHCKHLLDKNGDQFLRQCEQELNVSVRLEWRNFGKVLVVNGMANNQSTFHAKLAKFFKDYEKVKANYNTFANNLPKNRELLIKAIRQQCALLDSTLCNNKHVADVQTLYNRIRQNLRNPSKASLKQVSKLRKHLNMVLFGRYGLGDGRMHLNALQDQLRSLIRGQTTQVNQVFRKKIAEHIDFIFSDIDHENYDSIIARYHQLKREKSLPMLNLDRKLLGMNINIYSNGQPYDSNEHNINGTNYEHHSFSEDIDFNSSFRPNNHMNAMPSSADIQLNVSAPSTSYHSHGYNNSRPSQRQGCVSQNERVLDKWRF